MHDISRKSAVGQVIVHYPETEDGRCELRKCVAEVHADMVKRYIHKLDCPLEQKIELLDKVIETVKNGMGEQDR